MCLEYLYQSVHYTVCGRCRRRIYQTRLSIACSWEESNKVILYVNRWVRFSCWVLFFSIKSNRSRQHTNNQQRDYQEMLDCIWKLLLCDYKTTGVNVQTYDKTKQTCNSYDQQKSLIISFGKMSSRHKQNVFSDYQAIPSNCGLFMSFLRYFQIEVLILRKQFNYDHAFASILIVFENKSVQ